MALECQALRCDTSCKRQLVSHVPGFGALGTGYFCAQQALAMGVMLIRTRLGRDIQN